MEATVLLSFWALCLLLVVTPGPDWAFVLGQVLRGRGIAVPLTGIALGYLGLTTVVAAGLGAVVASHPAVLTAITVVGALILVKIGWSMLRSALRGPVDGSAPVDTPAPVDGSAPLDSPAPVAESAPAAGEEAVPHHGGVGGTVTATATTPATRVTTPAPVPGRLRVLLQGAAVSGLNPKGVMAFVALLPQFVVPAAAWPPGAQLFTLGLVFIASAMCAYSLLGLFARKVLAGSDRASRILTGVAGTAMLLLAAGMLGGQFLG
ncbi:LysE family translocator [Corynebacterium halotolerans]|uniref:Lysine exporter protein LysE/YggA n=1 Tax=Corynebacterium halotolerans YIM 70093 = DSM 44683 TaxID=1121362 RepID=M1NV53_9CORY|nr:LysE family translocator [Corynebacterium halotolerans]AGF73372.1 lysine exporter protein LysE/YggA [Corynebacterium halotolerans YIM 70093 = DSM 44683]